MNNDAAGYNGGTYDFRQQTFCLSMLTCLSFNLTGRMAESITTRFRTSVENVLNDEAAKALIGTWKLVWGPVIYADAFVGAKASVNSMFIAAPAEHPDQVVVALSLEFRDSMMAPDIEVAIDALEAAIQAAHPEVIAVFVKPEDKTGQLTLPGRFPGRARTISGRMAGSAAPTAHRA